jgi:hypothetical protein
MMPGGLNLVVTLVPDRVDRPTTLWSQEYARALQFAAFLNELFGGDGVCELT